MDSLGDRIKSYEAAYNYTLTPNSCVMIRVDGKAFHTYTKDWYWEPEDGTPFSWKLHDRMSQAMASTADQMQGFKLAYTQSDECTFLLTDFDTENTDGWFGYKLNKLVSVTASMYTAWFNFDVPDYVEPAIFDARAFVIPKEDAANAFVWRQKDWARNSVQMLARQYFSQKQLHGKKIPDMHEMLAEINVDWNELEDWQKLGSFYDGDMGCPFSQYMDYKSITEAYIP